jgi:transcriptional regulator with XRE-family HTH domain
MTTYDIISDLCKQRGIAITALEKELGFGRGYIGKFKTRGTSPTIKKLQQIADYFGVSINDLMPGNEKAEADRYYINPETAAIAQDIFENKELRLLFDAARDATVDDLKTTHDMLLALKRKERGNVD